MKTEAQITGLAGESFALSYLLGRGLTLITSNYRCKAGEIDIIMRDGPDLVFIEVRTRQQGSYGNGAESISYGKQRKLIKTASYFLLNNPLFNNFPSRFDVIDLQPANAEYHVNWIKAAFCAI